MKIKIVLLLMAIFCLEFVGAQNKKLSELNEETQYDETIRNASYIYGTTYNYSRKFNWGTLLKPAWQMGDSLRDEIDTAYSSLYSYINNQAGGSGYFKLSGSSSNYTLFPWSDSLNSSLNLSINFDWGGGYNPYRLLVNGDSYFNGELRISSAKLKYDGGRLKLFDIYYPNGLSLSDLYLLDRDLYGNADILMHGSTFYISETNITDNKLAIGSANTNLINTNINILASNSLALTSGADISLTASSSELRWDGDSLFDVAGRYVHYNELDSVFYNLEDKPSVGQWTLLYDPATSGDSLKWSNAAIGSPGGGNGYIQYNDNGNFGAAPMATDGISIFSDTLDAVKGKFDTAKIGNESYIFEDGNDLFLISEDGSQFIEMGTDDADGIYIYSENEIALDAYLGNIRLNAPSAKTVINSDIEVIKGSDSTHIKATSVKTDSILFNNVTSNIGIEAHHEEVDVLRIGQLDGDSRISCSPGSISVESDNLIALQVTGANKYIMLKPSISNEYWRFYSDSIARYNGGTWADAVTTMSDLQDLSNVKFNDTNYSDDIPGRLYYDKVTDALTFQNKITGFNHQLGREHTIRFYNSTGGALSDGDLIRSTGVHYTAEGDTIFVAGNSGIGSQDSLIGVAMVTAPCAAGTIGEATIMGQVNSLNHGLPDNTVLYLGHNGSYTTTPPEPPYWGKIIGKTVGSHSIYFFGFSRIDYYYNPQLSARFSGQTQTITNSGINVPALITNGTNNLYTEKINKGFVFQGDSARPLQNGEYTLNLSQSFQGDASTSDDWQIGIFKNGIELYSELITSNLATKVVVSFEITEYLTTSDWLTIKITNTENGTRNSVVKNGTFNYEYISQ